VLQALSLAEGLILTADSHHAKILRLQSEAQVQRVEIPVDVKKILDGTSNDVPLRGGDILFVRIAQTAEERLKVLRTPGVLGFVGSERQGTPIPDDQVENLRAAIREKIPYALHPFVSAGKRVRIRGGSLDGVEGITRASG